MLAQRKWRMLPVVVVAALAAAPLAADDAWLAVRARRILPVCPDLPWEIENGVILVRNGRIAAIGSDVEIPPGAEVVEFPFGTVVPGLVAAASDLGGRHRGDESIAAGYYAVDDFDRYGNYAPLLAAGVTTVHLGPGSHRLLTGQGAVVKLGGDPADRVLRARADLTINATPEVYNPPPDVTYPFPASADVPIKPPRLQRPASRLGQWLGLEEAIREALEETPGEPFSIHRPALAQAWQDGLPLRIHADWAADILGAIRFLQKHNRKGYLVGGAEAEKVAEALRRAKLSLVYQPPDRFTAPGGNLGTDPAVLDGEIHDFRRLEDITLALAPPAGATGQLRLAAIRASHRGLGRRRALEAITRTAARVLGVADRVGSLAVGKDADFVVFNGDPLEVTAHVERVYVGGRPAFVPPEEQPLVIKAGMVWAGPGRPIANGQILVENGKIAAVGTTVPHPPLARVIDVRPGGFVTPGFIDSFGHLGLAGDRTSGDNSLRLSKLIGAADVTDLRVCRAGVTTVLVAPYAVGSSGATVAAVKTAGSRREQRTIADPAAVLFDVHTADPAAIPEILNKPLEAGRKYLEALKKKQEADKSNGEEGGESRRSDRGPEEVKVDPAQEPLKALLEKKIPAMVNVSTAAQVRAVVDFLVGKHQLPVVLLNAEGAAGCAEPLAEKKITVIVPPAVLSRRFYRDYHLGDQLARRGVPIAFQSNAEDAARHLPAVALYAVERGLDAEAALAALTTNAARALKIDHRVGSIEVGKDADVVIFDAHPFLEGGRVVRVVVDGREVKP